jgi:hypothetical protein
MNGVSPWKRVFFDVEIHKLRIIFDTLLSTPLNYFNRVDFTSFVLRFPDNFVNPNRNQFGKILTSKD